MIVGGDFGENQKPSSVIEKLGDRLNSIKLNGGSISDIKEISTNLDEYDLIIWAPNISNEVEKVYPKKTTGSVLICSKVLRENIGFGDAIARIFKMNANAVIAINNDCKPFKFTLIDALGNVWCDTNNIDTLAISINNLYSWTKDSIRLKSTNSIFGENELIKIDLSSLCETVKLIADKVENERGGRYFGNVSTRCGKLFPSMRLEHDIVLISGRNVSKERITPDDFVYTKLVNGNVLFHGERKPSVDTPIQLKLYEHFKKINFLIHGHAYIKDALTTENYFPCGDLREFEEIRLTLSKYTNNIVLNLKNHGFLIGSSDLDQLKILVSNLEFNYRKIGVEQIKEIYIDYEKTH